MINKDNLKDFAEKAAVRAAYTIAETAIGVIGTATVMGDVNWPMVASASVLAGIVSILKSVIVGLPEAK